MDETKRHFHVSHAHCFMKLIFWVIRVRVRGFRLSSAWRRSLWPAFCQLNTRCLSTSNVNFKPQTKILLKWTPCVCNESSFAQFDQYKRKRLVKSAVAKQHRAHESVLTAQVQCHLAVTLVLISVYPAKSQHCFLKVDGFRYSVQESCLTLVLFGSCNISF